jgi:hypothetical protein
MATYLTSNIFSDIYVGGNCVVKGTLSSLGGAITSQWTTAGSTIYYSTGNVGIGTNNPTGSGSAGIVLHVADSTANNPTVHVDASIGTGQARLHLRSGTGSTNRASRIDFFNNVTSSTVPQWTIISGYDQNGTNDLRYVNYAGAITMAWAQNGNIGIGTTNPGSLLTVSGGVGIGSGYNAFTAPTGGLIVQGNVGIGTTNPGVNALQVTGNVVTQGFTSNAVNTTFNFDTLTLPFVNATQVGIGTTTPAYALDTVGDINASSTLRIGGLVQPRLISSGTFTGVTTFDTVTFDLVNYNIVEIRMTMYFSTTNQRVMSSQLLDTGGTVYNSTEDGWQVYKSGQNATGTGANIMNNTEIIGNAVGGYYSVIRLTGNQGLSQGVRNHWDWTTVGCYAGLGAATTFGRAAVYNTSFVTMNRMRFNLSGGTMTGKYSIINYSS